VNNIPALAFVAALIILVLLAAAQLKTTPPTSHTPCLE